MSYDLLGKQPLCLSVALCRSMSVPTCISKSVSLGLFSLIVFKGVEGGVEESERKGYGAPNMEPDTG